MIQTRIDAGARPSIIWQVWAFVILTAGETLVSPTHLEFSYTQGPVKMKSLIMCTYLLAISLGNQFTAAVNFVIQNPDGSVKLQGASYFMFFVYVMLGTAVLFAIVTPFYKGRTYLQDQAGSLEDVEAKTTGLRGSTRALGFIRLVRQSAVSRKLICQLFVLFSLFLLFLF